MKRLPQPISELPVITTWLIQRNGFLHIDLQETFGCHQLLMQMYREIDRSKDYYARSRTLIIFSIFIRYDKIGFLRLKDRTSDVFPQNILTDIQGNRWNGKGVKSLRSKLRGGGGTHGRSGCDLWKEKMFQMVRGPHGLSVLSLVVDCHPSLVSCSKT